MNLFGKISAPAVLGFLAVLATVRGSEICKAEEKIENCLTAVKDLKNFPSYQNSSLRRELAERCVKLEAGWRCAENFQKRCLVKDGKNIEKIVNGSRNAIQEICHEGVKKEKYLKNAECIKRAAHKLDDCQRNYNVTGIGELFISDINANTTNFDLNERSMKFCCSVRQHQECVEFAVRHECDEETGKFYRNFTDEYISSWMELCEASLEKLDSENDCPNVHQWKESFSTFKVIVVAIIGAIFFIMIIILVISVVTKFFEGFVLKKFSV